MVLKNPNQMRLYAYNMSDLQLTYLPATACALFGIEPPQLAEPLPHPSVMHEAARSESNMPPIQRMLIYAPDALGRQFLSAHLEELQRIRQVARCELPLLSVMPSVTPVCFASMFTGALPSLHGIQRYEKPVVTTDTLFDALLRAGKRVAIVAVRNSSIDIIFRGRELDYFTEDYDPQVTTRALELIEGNAHDFILAYHQEYDDMLHKTTPYSAECIAAFRRHVDSFAVLAEATTEHWRSVHHALAFTPDHGAHVDPQTGKGTHGSDCAEDLQILHFWSLR
jgi:hypothetical protein